MEAKKSKLLKAIEHSVCAHLEIPHTSLWRLEERNWRWSLSRHYVFYIALREEVFENINQIRKHYDICFTSVKYGLKRVSSDLSRYKIAEDDIRKIKLRINKFLKHE